MYKIHFGLRENPFNMTPDPRYIYLSDQHEDALVQLLYGIDNRKGFLLVSGEIGTGKTTISRTLLERVGDKVETALILNPYLNDSELLQTILEDFNIECKSESRKDMIDSINKFLIEQREDGRNVVLIIDEAQNLPVKSMELIRMLSNLETNTEKLLQIVLIGQPELLELLSQDNLRQLNQRITIRTKLGPLTKKDTKGYIIHRLAKAGAFRNNIFTSRAAREVFIFTKGNPRLINSLCDRALLCAYSFDQKCINKKTVEQAACDVLETKNVKRRNNFYLCAFYSLVILITLYFSFPTIKKNYFSNNASGTATVTAADGTPIDNPALTPAQIAAAIQAEDKELDALAPVINKAPEEYLETTTTATLERQYDVIEELPPVYISSNGRYLANNPDYSLEVSVMNLLNIWGEDSKTLKTIFNFEDPSVSIDFLLKKLTTYSIHLKSRYSIMTGRINTRKLKQMSVPAIVALRDETKINYFNYALIVEYNKYGVTVIDPVKGVTKLKRSEFNHRYMNDAIILYKSPFMSEKSLKQDMTASDVIVLEEGLKTLGYFDAEPDIFFDDATRKAVIRLQKKNGLKADGQVGTVTKLALIKSINKDLLDSSKIKADDDE